ncbi:MAG: hypothetical protein M1493_03465 [Firmicutes bacterium]|jgi:hypothetical protein|nr:hypothetical protein [Bacillota bacterium]
MAKLGKYTYRGKGYILTKLSTHQQKRFGKAKVLSLMAGLRATEAETHPANASSFATVGVVLKMAGFDYDEYHPNGR